MATIDEHRSRIAELKTRRTEIDQQYAGEPLPADATTEWNTAGEEIERLEAVVKELETREATIRAQAENPDATERPRTTADFQTQTRRSDREVWDLTSVRQEARSQEHEASLLRDNASRATEKLTPAFEAVKSDEARDRIQRLIDRDYDGKFSRYLLQHGSPVYARAFTKRLHDRELTQEERTALNVSNSATYAVPIALDPTIIPTTNGAVNPWRAVARTVTITGEVWKGVSSSGVTAAYISEETEATDASPTFSQPTGTVQKAQAFAQYSIEVGEDWPQLQSDLALMFAQAKDRLEAGEFATATGTAPHPVGILGVQGLTTAERVITTTSAAFAYGDVYALENALAPAYQTNAAFVANRAVYNAIRQFDTAGGAQLFLDNLRQSLGNPSNGALPTPLLGYPTFECSAMSSGYNTAGETTMLFGDFKNGFIIVDRIGMQVETIPHMLGSNRLPLGRRGVLAWWRNTSILANAAAFVYLSVKAT